MKKIIFTLLALVGTMSLNAQVVKVMNNDQIVAVFTADQANNVVFEEILFGQGYAAATGIGYVKWVQLWEDGPKFAEFNVGASSVTEKGTTMTFTEATKAGEDYVWGANWCTPSKEDMEHLKTAARGETDEKVKCEYTQEGSQYGFKFTGLTDGYTGNSVFFPAQDGSSSGYGYALYWSATANGGEAWGMRLYYYYGNWNSNWYSINQDYNYLVRPVLKIKHP